MHVWTQTPPLQVDVTWHYQKSYCTIIVAKIEGHQHQRNTINHCGVGGVGAAAAADVTAAGHGPSGSTAVLSMVTTVMGA